MSDISAKTAALLQRLADCQAGKGIAVEKPMRRTIGQLVGRGLVWTVGFGNFSVAIITDEGRAALSKARGEAA